MDAPEIKSISVGYDEYHFNSFDQFLRWKAQFSIGSNTHSPIADMVFRGVSHSDGYKLIPSAHRKKNGRYSIFDYQLNPDTVPSNPSVYDVIEAEFSALMSFFREANQQGLHLPESATLTDNYFEFFYFDTIEKSKEWYTFPFAQLASFAQHYGVPTRMLDWSFSVNSAAYFALEEVVRNIEANKPVASHYAIWGVNADRLMGIYDKSKKCPVRFVVPNYNHNLNIIGQQGLLSYVREKGLKTSWKKAFDPIPFDDIISKYLRTFDREIGNVKNDGLTLVKMVFPTKSAADELQYLVHNGVSAATIYPGYAGVRQKLEIDRAIAVSKKRIDDNDSYLSADALREEYYKRWGKLYYFVDRAYKDNQILHALEIHNDAVKKGEASFEGIDRIMGHIAQIAGEDLALCLCKICYDKDSKNNLSRFNAFLQKHYPEHALPTNEFQSLKQDESFVSDLIKIRDQWIAHNDYSDANVSLDYKQLWAALGKVTSLFNRLCVKEIDERIYPYSEIEIVKTVFDITVQMSNLLRNNQVAPAEKEQCDA